MHSRGTCNWCKEVRWLTSGLCPQCSRELKAAREQAAAEAQEAVAESKLIEQFVGELESVDDEAIWWELFQGGD